MRKVNIIFMVGLLTTLVLWGSGAQAATANTGQNSAVIQLTPGMSTAYVNQLPVLLDVPAFISDGRTLVPLRFIGEALELDVSWHTATKTVTLTGAEGTVTLTIGMPKAYANNQQVSLSTPPTIKDGRTMVPLRFVSEALQANVDFVASSKLITITPKGPVKVLPVARFEFTQAAYKPGETVNIIESSYHPDGLEIKEKEWVGRSESYPEAGRYQVGLRVKDEQGLWSSLVTKEIIVNTPPVAKFETDKKEYKIGQPINYTNQSYDPDGQKLTYTWENKESVYFEAGSHRVKLVVEDPLGGRDTYEKTIKVAEEVHYTRTEYYLLYGDLKKAIPFEEAVLDYQVISASIKHGERVLLKSNSPEKIAAPGILYRDTVAGSLRLMWHHLNTSGSDLRILVLAHNPSQRAVTVDIQRAGVSRPSSGILQQGREHLVQYFNSASRRVIIPAGGTVDLFNLGQSTLKNNLSISGLADLYVDTPLEFSFVAVRPSTDHFRILPELPVSNAGGQQVRGTFSEGDRSITVSATDAKPNSRLILGDGHNDPNALGIDMISQASVVNRGNYGIMYEIVFERLPANTAVLLNPRGGALCGAVRVNGEVWETPSEGFISPQSQAVVLRKIGRAGSLRIEFTPPAGSYLPVNILLVEMPERKE